MINDLLYHKDIGNPADIYEFDDRIRKIMQDDAAIQGELSLLESRIKKDDLPSPEHIREYEIDSRYYHLDSILHSSPHAMRVLVYSELLMKITGYEDDPDHMDPNMIRLAAITHDAARMSDLEDPDHGRIGAHLILEDPHGLAKRLGLGQSELAYAGMLILWHDAPDSWRYDPRHIQHQNLPLHKAIDILKDSDALDRVRDPGFLDRRYLRMHESLDLVEIAWYLAGISQYLILHQKMGHSDAVIHAGSLLGIIRD